MYSVKKYIRAIIFIIGFLLVVKGSFGQQVRYNFDQEKQKRITLTEFHRCVDRAVYLLQKRKLSAISDKDHIAIMMCLNTIFMSKAGLRNPDKRFNDERCRKLETVADEKEYRQNINKVYPQSIFSRGMGQYYPKLKMELYGTPNPYATFNVSK